MADIVLGLFAILAVGPMLMLIVDSLESADFTQVSLTDAIQDGWG